VGTVGRPRAGLGLAAPLAITRQGVFVMRTVRRRRHKHPVWSGCFLFSDTAMPTFRKSLLLALLITVTLAAWYVRVPPASAAVDPVTAAIQWLHSQQGPDGSFGRLNPKGEYTPSAAITADVVYALALAGEDPGGPAWRVSGHSSLDALALLAPTYIGADAGQAGKVARAVAAAGRDPRSFGGKDVIGVIEAAYNPATGRYSQNFLFRHATAMEALQRAGVPVPAAAYAALQNAQLPDGGWAWAFPVPGKPLPASDVDTTGQVLQVLSQSPLAGCDWRFARAANYLAHVQTANGAWAVDGSPTNLPNANSTGLAVGGLRAIDRNPGATPFIKGGVSGPYALLAFQEPSGAFRYVAQPGKEEVRLTATADALVGLLQVSQASRRSALAVACERPPCSWFGYSWQGLASRATCPAVGF
jgi:hypothetical protein